MKRGGEQAFGKVRQAVDACAIGNQFDQDVPLVRACQWRPRTRNMRDDVVERVLRHHLETLQRIARSILRMQQKRAGTRQRGHSGPEDAPLGDGWQQFQRGGGHDDDITLDVVEGIAKLKDELNPEIMRVVFKDAGFADDVVKTNAVQILKQAGIEDVRSL